MLLHRMPPAVRLEGAALERWAQDAAAEAPGGAPLLSSLLTGSAQVGAESLRLFCTPPLWQSDHMPTAC